MYQIVPVNIQWRSDIVIDLAINCPIDHAAIKYTIFSNSANQSQAKILNIIISLL